MKLKAPDIVAREMFAETWQGEAGLRRLIQRTVANERRAIAEFVATFDGEFLVSSGCRSVLMEAAEAIRATLR